MPKLFNLDIAGIVNREIAAAGGVLPGTLTKVTVGKRKTGSLSKGTNPKKVASSFRGFLEDRDNIRLPGQLTAVSGRVLVILGGSLPAGVEPEANDTALIEGDTFDIVAIIGRDPAAATYECLVQK